jgi:S-adenosylmethionine synthetase
MLLRQDQFTFTSEAVSEGHPDKVCDQISDAILDAALAQDCNAHVACETLATTDYVLLSGEVRPNLQLDADAIVRDVVKSIGYDRPGEGFDYHTLKVESRLHCQSDDIAQGVDADTSLSGEQGAGDQGIMFGYACDETEQYMPAPIYYSHLILRRLAQLRHEGKADFLRPDAKSQLSFYYENGVPRTIRQIVVSHQHIAGAGAQVHALVKDVLHEVLPAQLICDIDFEHVNASGESSLHINPTGNFVIGGPNGDTGITGRKIIVDTYGGMGRHGGGAFSGKDPSKVDRSACYMARYAAKNIVAAGLASRCEIQVAYAIGIAKPLAFYVNFFGTGKVSEASVEKMLHAGEIFDFRPASCIETLGLLKPQGWNYRLTASGGHYGRECFPWEKLDKVAAIKAEFSL